MLAKQTRSANAKQLSRRSRLMASRPMDNTFKDNHTSKTAVDPRYLQLATNPQKDTHRASMLSNLVEWCTNSRTARCPPTPTTPTRHMDNKDKSISSASTNIAVSRRQMHLVDKHHHTSALAFVLNIRAFSVDAIPQVGVEEVMRGG